MKGQDDIVRKRIEAKNGLENYTYNIKNALNDEKFKDKFKPEERTQITKLVDDTVKWVESN
jgi:heat shock protein 1/8